MSFKLNTYLSAVLFFAGIASGFAQDASPKVEPGVSLKLATYRHAILSDLQYTLGFNIPANKTQAIDATESITFSLKSADELLQLDFKQSSENIKSITVNNFKTPVSFFDEHLLIDKKYLHTGINKIDLEFIAGNESLNRNDDYLYALFVPDRARTVFPCFDQPDLKSRFLLTLQVPSGWKVLANGIKKDSVVKGDSTTFHFANSDKLPTYLFSFTAGKYTYAQQSVGKHTAEFLYRETDPTKIKLSVDSVFIGHKIGEHFFHPYIIKPLHGYHIAKPHVCGFVRNKV